MQYFNANLELNGMYYMTLMVDNRFIYLNLLNPIYYYCRLNKGIVLRQCRCLFPSIDHPINPFLVCNLFKLKRLSYS